MAALDRDLTAGSKRLSRQQAERAQVLANAAGANDLGSDRSFSGWLPGGLDTTIMERGQDAILTPDGRLAAAKWTTAELGRRSGQHGTTKPMRTASDAQRAIERDPEIKAIAERGVQREIRKHFDMT